MKCNICEKETEVKTKVDGHPDHWSINGSVLGKYIEIQGCEVCLENVNNKIVIPNRLSAVDYEKKGVEIK